MKRLWMFTALAITISLLMADPTFSGTIKGKLTCGSLCSNMVLYVEDVPGEWSGTGEVAVLDQKNKEYLPHVMALLKGTAVRLSNADPELHNVHAYLNKETVFNIGILPELSIVMKKFKEPGTYVMLCDRHTEMSAYIVVLGNPYFTQPDPDGNYEIRDVPEGTYTLVRYDPEEKEISRKELVISSDKVTAGF